MKQRGLQIGGFTLVELLVVIGIVGILAAIIVPTVSKARERGRQATCLSNERQLAVAIIQYADDSDETYPWSYSDDGAPGKVNWPGLVSPYVSGPAVGSSGNIFVCPDSLGHVQTYSTNSEVIGLYGTEDEGENYYQSTVPMGQVADPTHTVLLADGIFANPTNPNASNPMEYAYPHPALIKDHTNDPTWAIDWAVPNTDGDNNKQIAWIHSGGANFVFCDGHAKWEYRGQLTDANWDVRCTPGVGCTGHSYPPNPADYPADTPACSDESALDCE